MDARLSLVSAGEEMTEEKNIPVVKKCGKCKKIKPLSAFHNSKSRKYGKASRCKECLHQYYLEHRDHIVAVRYAWYVATKEAFAEKDRIRRARKAAARKAAGLTSKGFSSEAQRAYHILAKAIAKGEVIRPKKCPSCNKVSRVHGHHEDYSKPLDVQWLCAQCHGKIWGASVREPIK